MYFTNQHAQPMPAQYRQEQTQQPPRTAINELDAFLSGLAEDERGNILASPDFAPLLGEFLNKFLFFLAQGELGALYVASSAHRREMAEVLKLTAHKLHAEGRKTARSDVKRLEQENRKLQKRLQELEGGKA